MNIASRILISLLHFGILVITPILGNKYLSNFISFYLVLSLTACIIQVIIQNEIKDSLKTYLGEFLYNIWSFIAWTVPIIIFTSCGYFLEASIITITGFLSLFLNEK